jgi:hypothetical protein
MKRCGIRISDNVLDGIDAGGRRRSLYTKSFAERTDLKVIKWRTKRELIRIPVDRKTCLGSEKKISPGGMSEPEVTVA